MEHIMNQERKMNRMDDLITRQVVIDELHKYFTDGFEQDRWWNSTQVLCAIKNCPPACEWIPVTERLPEERGTYLVSGKWANEDGEVWICEFKRLYNWGWCNKADRPVVRAWMPLPEPYKEK